MDNQLEEIHIKQILISQFKIDFDIEKLVDTNSPKSESFEYSIGFEFKYQCSETKENIWNDAYMHVYGNVAKRASEVHYHEPFKELGGGEWQGGEVSIEEIEINECEVFLNGKKPTFFIDIKELNKIVYEKNK